MRIKKNYSCVDIVAMDDYLYLYSTFMVAMMLYLLDSCFQYDSSGSCCSNSDPHCDDDGHHHFFHRTLNHLIHISSSSLYQSSFFNESNTTSVLS